MSCGWPRARFHRCPCAPHGVRVARSDAIVGLAQERFEAEFARARRPVVVTGLLEMESAQEMRAATTLAELRSTCGHLPVPTRVHDSASTAWAGLKEVRFCLSHMRSRACLTLGSFRVQASGLPNTSRDRGLGGTLAEWLDSEGESFVFDWSLHAPEARAANTGLILPTIRHS